MSIKLHYEQLIANLEAEREREVAIIKERATREKIVPFNKEMDEIRDKAIAEKQDELNNSIAACQEMFLAEKKRIIEAAEKKKNENAASVLATETYTVTGVYDKEISHLKDRVANLKEN
jgi:hypothetical protein